MTNPNPPRSALTSDDVRAVSPVLEKYTGDAIVNDLWKRPDLSSRDRSIITAAALIARNQTIGMLHYFNIALDSGVKPSELSEIVAHMAFYAGWSNAFSAVAILKDIFAQRGVGVDQLPEISPKLLSIEHAVPDENVRVQFIQQNIRPVSAKLAQFTDDLLYHEVWLRPGLTVRDRNLVTVCALIASGQTTYLPFYLNRAVLQGVTKTQVAEMLTHLAFYAGWPIVFSSVPVVKNFFDGSSN